MRLADQLNKLSDIEHVYASLNKGEKFGIRYGLFPFWIKKRMDEWSVTAADLMKYDEIIRSRSRH